MFLNCVAIFVGLFLILLWLFRFVVRIIIKATLGRCKCNVYLAGKTALVTGGNSGLGFQTAVSLAGRGCRVILADRNNCDQSKALIIKQTGNTNIVTKQFDLACLKSVRQLAKDINETEETLDILVNNAGVSGLGNGYTEDGLHKGMQINHFGPFLLTHLLIGLLKKSAPSRIIFVSSALSFINNLTYENLNYFENASANWLSELMIYANSKLCNIITVKELSKKLYKTGVTVNAVHPGLVNTPIFQRYAVNRSVNAILQRLFDHFILQCFAKNPEEGAQTAIHLALASELENVTGRYFSDCQISTEPSKSKDQFFTKKIWELSEECVKLSPDELL